MILSQSKYNVVLKNLNQIKITIIVTQKIKISQSKHNMA